MKKESKKNKHRLFKKKDGLLLGVILVIALVFRVYKLNNPVADWHSWRQADTAAVARNFVRGGFDLLHPRYDDLGSNQTGYDNPRGYRMVEFPLYSAIFAATYKLFPYVSLEIHGRFISALFSLMTMMVIYYLLLKEDGRVAGFFGALFFATMPFFVYYSRVILPEPTATAMAFISIFFLYQWQEQKKPSFQSMIFIVLSILFFALALLVKPTTVFYLIPLFYLFWRKFKLGLIKKPQLYLYFLLIAVPLIIWRLWIKNFPEGIPASSWLITSVNTWEGQKNIFFRPAFFRWIFYERIGNIITGSYALVFLILGIVKKPKKSFLGLWIGFAALAYLFTFQGGNVQHDYYQTLILPALAIICGSGAAFLFEEKISYIHYVINCIVVATVIIFSFLFSYYRVKDYYSTDPDLLNVAKIVNTVTKPESKLVTDRDGDTTLLYLADRKGYAAVTGDLSGLKEKGMEYFVTLHKEVAEQIKKEKKFESVFESEKVYVFKL